MTELSPSARRVQDAIISAGLECCVVELPASTRTAQEAADAIGCTVSQIVKSLVFRGKQSGRGIFVAASGSNRVNEKRLKEYAGEGIEKASPDFVREMTGFAIGGVAPIAHLQEMESYIDQDLLGYSELWAAAGTPNAVFRMTPGDLTRLSPGRVVDIT
jgi:prolyl-tRNA editing enzyme YbaK/EbsC (Cys-tRNA(Pro) deacylase)